jgi:hypothetical protein
MKKRYVIYFVLFGFAITSCKSEGPDPVTPDKPVIDSVKSGLSAYYPFNNSAIDATGRGNNGEVYGATLTTDRFGKSNSAYSFDGASNYIKVNDSPDLRLYNTDFTINVWVNLDSYNDTYGNVILGKRASGSAAGWVFGIEGNAGLPNDQGAVGKPFYQVSDGDDPLGIGVKVLHIKQWHMITVVYIFSQKLLGYYFDGVLDNSITDIPVANNAITTALFIGADSQNLNAGVPTLHFTKGKIDDIRIYNRLLTQAEVTSLYTLPN